jgi:LysM repeat protein
MFGKTFFSLGLALFSLGPALAATSPDPEKPEIYTVSRGDSLWKIARETWGDGSKWPLLYAANQEAIHDPNLIFPGQNIVIPTEVQKGQLKQAMNKALQASEGTRSPSGGAASSGKRQPGSGSARS